MKRSRFSEERIIAILKQQESGVTTADVCREQGISSATFYKWKARFGGLEVSVSDVSMAIQPRNRAAAMIQLNRDPCGGIAGLAEVPSRGKLAVVAASAAMREDPKRSCSDPEQGSIRHGNVSSAPPTFAVPPLRATWKAPMLRSRGRRRAGRASIER